MKKIIILVRHATAIDWADFDWDDFHRFLKKEGKKEAKKIWKLLKKLKLFPTVMISSSATRCMETSTIVAKELDIKTKSIHYTASLYDGNLDTYLGEISKIQEQYSLVCICGHNPTISEFGKKLSLWESPTMDKWSVLIIHFKKDIQWSNLNNGKIDVYISPKII